MKGAIYHGIENVSVEEIEMPECGDYDVILKNVKGSICGTDVGAYYHGGDDAGIYPENQFGHEIPMYDLERTICDLVRSRRNFEIQDFNMAIKTYLQRSDKDLNRLMVYAKAFRIEKIIRQYMEVLL